MPYTDPTAAGPSFDALLRLVRRQWWILLLCIVVPTVVAYAVSTTRPSRYTATASLLFNPDTVTSELFGFSSGGSSNDPDRVAATNVALVESGPAAVATARKLGMSSADVADAVSVDQSGQTNIVHVNATDKLPAVAARIATTYAESFVDTERERAREMTLGARDRIRQQLDNSGRVDAATIRTLRERAEQLLSLAAVQSADVTVLEEAAVPASPSAPRPKRAAMLGLIFGVLLAGAWLLLRQRFGQRLDDPEAAAEASGYRVLAEVPQSRRLSLDPLGDVPPDQADAIRLLRAQLRYFNVDRPLRTVLVASGSANAGKSTIAQNLALVACEGYPQEQVLLIEADLRRPKLAAQAGIRAHPGLAEVLSGQAQLEEALQTVRGPAVAGPGGVKASKLAVLTAGQAVVNPAQLIGSKRMRDLLAELGETFTLIVIDSTPLVVLSDALPLAAAADGVVVVTRVRHSTRREAHELHELLDDAHAHVLGTVINGVPPSSSSGYGSYYDTAAEPVSHTSTTS